jgi:hypothetical protein
MRSAPARVFFMRKLTDHKLNGVNEALEITVLDQPGAGNACHLYAVSFDYGLPGFPDGRRTYHIDFQNGPLGEVGVNGLTQEALLAILIDRLRGFQSGQFACRENAIALTHLEEALMWLQKRTRERLARGVEGTSQK